MPIEAGATYVFDLGEVRVRIETGKVLRICWPLTRGKVHGEMSPLDRATSLLYRLLA